MGDPPRARGRADADRRSCTSCASRSDECERSCARRARSSRTSVRSRSAESSASSGLDRPRPRRRRLRRAPPRGRRSTSTKHPTRRAAAGARRHERREAYAAVRQVLDAESFERLLRELETFASSVGSRRVTERARAHGRAEAAQGDARHRERRGAAHARVNAKRLRYAAEVVGTKDVVERAREFQDVVGEHQDAVVAEERLRALAKPSTALLVGRLIERSVSTAPRGRTCRRRGSGSRRRRSDPRRRRRDRARRRGPARPPAEVRRLVAAEGEVQDGRERRGLRAPRDRRGDRPATARSSESSANRATARSRGPKVVRWYLMRRSTASSRPSDEIDEIAWVPIYEAGDRADFRPDGDRAKCSSGVTAAASSLNATAATPSRTPFARPRTGSRAGAALGEHDRPPRSVQRAARVEAVLARDLAARRFASRLIVSSRPVRRACGRPCAECAGGAAGGVGGLRHRRTRAVEALANVRASLLDRRRARRIVRRAVDRTVSEPTSIGADPVRRDRPADDELGRAAAAVADGDRLRRIAPRPRSYRRTRTAPPPRRPARARARSHRRASAPTSSSAFAASRPGAVTTTSSMVRAVRDGLLARKRRTHSTVSRSFASEIQP